MPITIQKGTNSAYFKIIKSENGTIEICVVNDYNLKKESDGTISLIKNADHYPLIDCVDPATIINGDTGQPFANYDAIETYAIANFFREAGGGAGGLAISTIEDNTYDFSKYREALWIPIASADLIFSNEPSYNYSSIIYCINNNYILTISGEYIPMNSVGITTITIKKINEIYYYTSDATPFTPIILTNPEDQTILAGDELNLFVDYIAFPTPTVQWEKSIDNGEEWLPVTGATNKLYSKISVTGDAGKYRAKITNEVGSVYSLEADIIINTAASDVPLVSTTHPNIAINPFTSAAYPTPRDQYSMITGTTESPFLFNGKIPAGQAGYVTFDTAGYSGDNIAKNMVLGFQKTAAPATWGDIWNSIRYDGSAMFVTGFGNIAGLFDLAPNTRYKLNRAVDGTITTWGSADDGVTYSLLTTFIDELYTGDLYIVGSLMTNDGLLTGPRGYNVVI